MKLSNVSPDLDGFGSTLEMDSGHKNKKIGLNPKCLRPFLKIVCVVDDMHTCMLQELFSCTPR